MNDLVQNQQANLPKRTFTHFGDAEVTDEVRKQSEVNSDLTHFTGENFANLKDDLCGYSLKSVGVEKCPKCDGDIENQYCDFVYVVKDVGMRVGYGPHGYFCKSCPTVVINTIDLKDGVLNDFHRRKFLRPIGLDLKGDLYLFREWNGKKPLFLIDDIDEQIFDVEGDNAYREKQRMENKALALGVKKLASKKRMQKKSKKKNRRK